MRSVFLVTGLDVIDRSEYTRRRQTRTGQAGCRQTGRAYWFDVGLLGPVENPSVAFARGQRLAVLEPVCGKGPSGQQVELMGKRGGVLGTNHIAPETWPGAPWCEA